jgi:hypothetical protein
MSNVHEHVESNSQSLRPVPRSAAKKRKSGGRKYGRKASEKVEGAMHEMKRGKLQSGRSKRKVKSRKQAIAIGLSEARKEGGKVPKAPKRKKAGKRKTAKRKTAKRKTAKRKSAKRGKKSR